MFPHKDPKGALSPAFVKVTEGRKKSLLNDQVSLHMAE